MKILKLQLILECLLIISELSKDMEECLLLPEEQTSDFLDDTLSERSTVIVNEAEHPPTTPVSAGSNFYRSRNIYFCFEISNVFS